MTITGCECEVSADTGSGSVEIRDAATGALDRRLPSPSAIRGLAWSGQGAITRVEVSVDDGRTWHDAHIEEPRDRWLWVRWSWLWEADRPGAYRIIARATDEAGRVQPQVPWNYQRKHFDGIVPTDITIA